MKFETILPTIIRLFLISSHFSFPARFHLQKNGFFQFSLINPGFFAAVIDTRIKHRDKGRVKKNQFIQVVVFFIKLFHEEIGEEVQE